VGVHSKGEYRRLRFEQGSNDDDDDDEEVAAWEILSG